MIFARKSNKIAEFYTIFPENARILHNNCPKNIFPEFFWVGACPPSCPRLLRLSILTQNIFESLQITGPTVAEVGWPRHW